MHWPRAAETQRRRGRFFEWHSASLNNLNALATNHGDAEARHTRIPVPVDEIPYSSIASMSRLDPGSLSGGRIAAIALGSAGAAIGTLFLIMLASLD